jgi:Spy/CpxP family protein refolding chaperone
LLIAFQLKFPRVGLQSARNGASQFSLPYPRILRRQDRVEEKVMKTSTFNNVMFSAVGLVGVTYLALVTFATADMDAGDSAPQKHEYRAHEYRAWTKTPLVGAVHQLNLSSEQRKRIHLLIDQTELHAAALKTNLPSLTVLANPGDPGYADAVQAAKTNAENLVQRRSDLHVQIYAVLTPEQQAKLPAVLANMEAKKQQRIEKHLQRNAQASTG